MPTCLANTICVEFSSYKINGIIGISAIVVWRDWGLLFWNVQGVLSIYTLVQVASEQFSAIIAIGTTKSKNNSQPEVQTQSVGGI